MYNSSLYYTNIQQVTDFKVRRSKAKTSELSLSINDHFDDSLRRQKQGCGFMRPRSVNILGEEICGGP